MMADGPGAGDDCDDISAVWCISSPSADGCVFTSRAFHLNHVPSLMDGRCGYEVKLRNR